MADPLTTSAIVSLALQKLIESASRELAKKFTESRFFKVDELRIKIREKLQGQPKAEASLTAVEKGSKSELERLAAYLKVEIENDAQFALEVTSLAQAINAERLQDYSSMVQSNYGDAIGFQTKVADGTAYIGEIYFHQTSSKAPDVIPKNVPRSGVGRFTGRDAELKQLHQQLQQGDRVAISAISGMAGVGKTELAIQYAKSHENAYPGGICWLSAREFDVGTQIVSYAMVHLELRIPDSLELNEQVAFCWRNWLPGNVLVILDDVVNYSDIQPYLPPVERRFKVLITTRLKFGSPIQTVSLGTLTPEKSLELLENLIGRERIQQELEIANTLCHWLGFLPLGLELVGHYLAGKSDLSLAEMMFSLQTKALQDQSLALNPVSDWMLTAQRSVKSAFELSWEMLDKRSQYLGKLLSLFAPAPIPWELVESVHQKYCEITPEENGDFALDELETARINLIRHCLLQRVTLDTYQLHPLIRQFFRDKLESIEEEYLAQQIPEPQTHELIEATESVSTDLQPFVDDVDLNSLFIALDRYYETQEDDTQLIALSERCLSETRERLGEAHPDVAKILSNLAYANWLKERYSEAELLYLKALELNRQLLGEEHPIIASSLNDLACLYEAQGRYSEAEPLYQTALSLNQRLLGDEHPSIASSLSNLAGFYAIQGNIYEAEALYRQALKLNEKLLGGDHPIVASTLNYLANLHHSQGRYVEAEVFLTKSLIIREQQLGANHPDTATSLNNLAALYKSQGRYNEAEPLYLQALTIREQQLGSDHPDTATNLNNLAALYEAMGRYAEAEPLLMRSLCIREQKLGVDHPDIATSLNNLAALYESTGHYTEAEPLYLRAIAILEQTLGNQHPQLAQSLNNLAGLYKSQGRYTEAESLYLQSLLIREQVLGDNHPYVATSLNNLAVLYASQGNLHTAKLLFHRALEISQKSLGNNHPLSQSLRLSLEAVQ